MELKEVEFTTLPELLARSARTFADTRAIFDPHQKPIVEMTYADLAKGVARFAAGLIELGVKPGNRVALFSDNQPNWLIADLAICGIGAVTVPRGSDTAVPEFEFILNHSGARIAIVQNRKLYDRLSQSETFSKLDLIIIMESDTKTLEDTPRRCTFARVLELGTDKSGLYDDASHSVTSDTLASIVYTSGTTGSPKGVMLTHGNLVTQPLLVDLGYKPLPGEIQLSILPSWHAYERATEYFGLYHGTTLTYSDKRYLRDDLLKLCPQLLPCVPRIWEMIYKAVMSKVSSATPKQQKIFQFFITAGTRFIHARRIARGISVTREPLSVATRMKAKLEAAMLGPVYQLGDKLVYSKLRNITGGRLRAAISGGGSLAPYLDDFFEVVGIPILNGYGLTETSPVISVRTVTENVRGTVGKAIASTQIEIRNEAGNAVPQGAIGEIWAKGPQVMQGYYDNPEATSKVLKDDGWFLTGDLGWLTASGHLVITGRAKDTIVLSSGENVEPEPIEDACRKSPYVTQILLVGQDQKTLGALVVPDYTKLAEALNLPSDTAPQEIASASEAEKFLKNELAKVMAADGRFKAAESISKVVLLTEPFSETNGMLTNTMKIKRNVVTQKYADTIAGMYR